MLAMLQKEWMELVRGGRLLSLAAIFVVFGIMNPAIAKLTPWMMEVMAEEMAETGLVVTAVKVDALTSWTQFFKNIPMALLAFVVLHGGILANELQTGTLTLIVTKGLQRWKILTAKMIMTVFSWTAGYWLCYGITYGYNAYFWDNSVAEGLSEAVTAWWLFGLWTIAIMFLISILTGTTTGTCLGTGIAVAASYVVGLVPKAADYCPTKLTGGMAFIHADSGIRPETLLVTLLTLTTAVVISIVVFNKKNI